MLYTTFHVSRAPGVRRNPCVDVGAAGQSGEESVDGDFDRHPELH
jgi:hypothetical protein